MIREFTDAIKELASGEDASPFAIGQVEHIDVATSPHTYHVDSRAMPMLASGATGVAVGDLVIYIDQNSPIGIGKLAGT